MESVLTSFNFIYYKYINPSKKVVNNKDGFGIQALIYWTYKITADVESINSKNRTYYFFDSSLSKIDKNSYRSIDIYYIRYITIKKIDDYNDIYSVNPLYLIVNTVDEHNEEKNGNKYIVFDSTGKNKEVLNKYTELWDGIKHLIWKIDDKPNVV